MNNLDQVRVITGLGTQGTIKTAQDNKMSDTPVTQDLFYKDNQDFENRPLTIQSSISSEISIEITAKSDLINDKNLAANEVKLSKALMYGFALVSKKDGARFSAQRFTVLTSNKLSCYKETGISPFPTYVIKVQNIVNIHCSLRILTITVSSSKSSQNLVLTLDT